ncbi:carboxylesterase [Rickenella mellea]|uniref:Carboxylic ester hydrolase n=1 Tax=Rickenella mellea TaxID=50990 RepID=A0A4Y7PHH3_9AGAM|nr:carboxylesterase [Rickenella mellea]
MMSDADATTHLSQEISERNEFVKLETKHGWIIGGKVKNGAVAFLEVTYALPPYRFEDAQPIPEGARYNAKEYVYESCHSAQPDNDGQAAGIPRHDKLGFGKPLKNPLFVNIVVPSSYGTGIKYPVKVYIHGGFLQFGSPHSLNSQAQYVAEERNEIWVNIGYRLSAFGFLASDQPPLSGNFGFKDQWVALMWIRDNIASFGGDPENIQITGLSAGAYSVHQILHHASRLPEGETAPFRSAVLQSNAMQITPKTPAELRPQFEALCHALGLDPTSKDILRRFGVGSLRDMDRLPWPNIIKVIENDLNEYGTFRACLDGTWMASHPDSMTWQRNGGFAEGLRRVGVKSVIVGDLTEEWYLYSIAHPINTPADIALNLRRYYPHALVEDILNFYPKIGEDANPQECAKLFGEILSDCQVHMPVRLLARDLINHGFPVLRYEMRWTPEKARSLAKGYVTHATDQTLWKYRVPTLLPEELSVAREWLDSIDNEINLLEREGRSVKGLKDVLTLRVDRSIAWTEDQKYDEVMRLIKAFPNESS